MSQSKLIIKGSAISVVHMSLQVIVAFFLTPFIILHLGKQLYGIWILIGTFVGYYGLMDLGISGAVMRFVSRAIGSDAREDINYYVSSAFFVLFGAGLLTCIISVTVFLLAGFFIGDPTNLHLFQSCILILGFSVGLSFPLRVFDGFLNANLRVDLKRYIEIFQIVYRTLMVIIALKMGYGVLGLAVVSGAATLIDFFIKAVFSFKIDPSLKVKLKYFRVRIVHEMKDFTFFNFLQSFSRVLIQKVDPFMVAWFLELNAVAFYGVALSLAGYFEEFFRAFLMVLFPVFSQKEGSRDFKSIRFLLIISSRISIILSTFIGTVTILYARQFLERWLGLSFTSSYPIVVILIIPLIFSIGFTPSVFVLNSFGEHRVNAYFDIAQGVLNVCLSILLGFAWGSIGIALGTAIPLVILGGFAKSFYACKSVAMSCLDYWGKVFYSMLATLFLVLPVWFFWGQKVESNYLALMQIFSVHLLIFAVFGYKILLPREDMQFLLGKLHSCCLGKFPNFKLNKKSSNKYE